MSKTASAFVPTAAFTLAVGLLLAALGSGWLMHTNQVRVQAAVAEAAQRTVDAVLNRVRLYQYGLRGARGVVAVLGEQNLTRPLFHRYAQTRDVNAEFPGARGFGFVRRVRAADQAAFIERARADGAPAFDVHQLTAQPGDRLVVQYLEPAEAGQAAIGLDIASEPVRRSAALDAIRSGEARLTGPITLLQATGRPEQSFLILMPVYASAAVPSNEADREAQAVGLTFAPLLMTEMLAALALDLDNQHVMLSDVTHPGQPKVFFNSAVPEGEQLYPQQLQADVFGRRWQLDLSVSSAFIEPLGLLSPGWVLLAGLLASVLLAAVAGAVALGLYQRRQMAGARMELGSHAYSASAAVIGQTLQGRVGSWNQAAELLFGYSAEQAVGRSLTELVVPAARAHEEQHMLARIAAGEVVGQFETERHNQLGETLDVSISPSPVYDPRGNVVGASLTVRDISLQKAQAAQIIKLNAKLRAQVNDSMATNRAILEAVIDPVLTVDANGCVRSFNPAGTQLFGYGPQAIVGQNVKKLMPRVYWRLIDRLIARGMRQRNLAQQRRFEISGQRQDGSIFPARVSVGIKSSNDERVYVCVVSDITLQRRQHSELMAMRDQLLLAAEAAELGIWAWDLATDEVHWNERMNHIYGLPSTAGDGKVLLQCWLHRLHPADQAPTQAALNALVESGTPYAVEFRVILGSGQVRYVKAAGKVERGLDGRPKRVTGINLDITAQREMEARLRQAKAQADDASAAKSAFLANMSHEIRTPMNAVLGMLQLMQRTALDAQQMDYLAKARQAATSLLELLNDVLDYSKIEAGKLALDPYPFELDALLQELAVIMAGNQSNKEVEAVFDIDPRIPPWLVGDALRLKQVLVNLAGNALKFTLQGEVVVRLSLLHRLGRGVGLRIAVQDSGIGIGADQRERIFEGFNQAEASTTRRFGGTGLGLVISNRLVRLMGGTLQLDSEPGVGSRFWFDIVLEADRSEAHVQPPNRGRPSWRLLVADDNGTSADVLARTVRAQGWHADAVSSGFEAVARVRDAVAQANPYDLLLIDWRMPELDGLAAARQIHDSLGAAAPRMIMVTAYSDDMRATTGAPGEDFVALMTKPVTPLQLRNAVCDALGGAPAQRVLPPAQRPLRLAGLYVLVVEDNALNRQVASGLLRAEGARVRLAENGQEGTLAVLAGPEPYDAVLMDVQMPGIDGLEATRQIRADPRFTGLPIIAMTANAGAEDRTACLQAGMNDHLGKPIDLNHLVDVVRHWAGRSKAPPPLAATPARAAGGLLEDWNAIMARFDGDLPLLRQVLGVFVSDCGALLQRLRQLMAEPDSQTARAVFHAIKGSAATMGAQALSERAGALELGMSRDDPDVLAAWRAGTCVDELAELLQGSAHALCERLGEAQPEPGPEPGTAPAALPPEQWRGQLLQLEVALQTGNLQALKWVQQLAEGAPAAAAAWLPRLAGQVKALDFKAALGTLRNLRETLQ
ncbi:CHASE domain-containing protein [Pseudomonas typographi]|uniref:CHASE domain-containing protein n=1 Tax=Pseudomonas typographi TaxID=2715964 RepID=UPI00168473F3|nr:CHASE domain-containing protein [Pseudomonas typographi]MBD1553262.1 PAS domain S-box protein [Pseudomonas typographi]